MAFVTDPTGFCPGPTAIHSFFPSLTQLRRCFDDFLHYLLTFVDKKTKQKEVEIYLEQQMWFDFASCT